MAMTRVASHIAINPAIDRSTRRPTSLGFNAVRRHHTSLGFKSICCHNTEAIQPVLTEKDLKSEENLKDLFERWLSYHDLEKDLDDKDKRFKVFKDSAKRIHEFNKQGHSFTIGLNEFSAMTTEEFRNTYILSGCRGFNVMNERVWPFQFFPKDLESEDNLWRLYENWCRYYSLSMDRADIQKRFSVFKEKVRCIYESSKLDKQPKFVLNPFADRIR